MNNKAAAHSAAGREAAAHGAAAHGAGSRGAAGPSPRGRPAPGGARPPSRRPSRRTTQVRRNAVVLAWIATAGILAVLVIGGPLASWGAWLPLHALLLGGIGSAITIWSAHFADTLLHRPALGGAVLLLSLIHI